MRFATRFFIAAATLATLIPPIPASAKPNFSGTWKLDLAQCAFGGLRSPKSRTDRIRHQEPALKLNITQNGRRGEVSYELNYTTDGRENHNRMLGNPLRSRLKWEGDVLIVETQGTLNGVAVAIEDRWTLSADGQTLRIARQLSGAAGTTHQRLVFARQ